MADQSWYKMEVNGQWYQTQAESEQAARDFIMKTAAPPKQYFPEVEQAIRTVPRPSMPPETGLWEGLKQEQEAIPAEGRARTFVHGQVVNPKYIGRGTELPGIGDWTGMSGYPEAVAGAERFAEPGKENKYAGAAQMIGGALQTTAPLMLAGGVANPRAAMVALGGAVGGAKAGEYGTKLAGGGPEAQALGSQLGGLVGGAAFGTGEWYRERYLSLVDQAKSDLRASRGFGAGVDESLLQKSAEQKVQIDIAKGNSLPNLSREAAHAMIRAAQAGTFTRPQEKVAEGFGTSAQPEAPKPLRPEELQDKLNRLNDQVEQERARREAQTRPLTPPERVEDAVEQARRRAPEPPPVKPQENMVPEGQRASDVIAREQAEALRRKIESRGQAKEMLEKQGVSDTERQKIQSLWEPRRQAREEEINQLREDIAKRRGEVEARKAEELAKVPEAKPEEGESPLDRKQRESRNRQREEMEVRAAVEQHRQARDAEIARLQKENAQLREQSKVSPELAPPPSTPGTPAIAVPPPRETTGPREPIRPTQGPSLTQEQVPSALPRSREEGKQASGRADFAQRMALFAERVENERAKPENKGVSLGEIQRRVNEQMKRERGGFGGSSPEDIRARREAKINKWIDTLRDVKTPYDEIDRTFANLKSYGLSHDEILRRVSGSYEGPPPAGSTPPVKPEGEIPREQRGQEQVVKEETLSLMRKEIDNLRNMVQNTLADHHLTEVDTPEAKQMKKELEDWYQRTETQGSEKDVEELNKIFNLRDQRGFWTMMPPKRGKVRPTSSALDELTNKFETSLRASAPKDNRMLLAEKLDKAMTEGWDDAQKSIARLGNQLVALRDMVARPPTQNDYTSAIGRFSGSLNRATWELRTFTKAIKDKIPDPRRREAITNWIQANGDDQLLAQRAQASKGYLRAGYERARNLTQDEIGFAKMIEKHFDNVLKEAIKNNILKDGLENYVPQIWKPKDQQGMSSYFSSLHKSGLVKTDFNAAKQRMFASYFDGEKMGYTPVNKDIGFLVASWDRAYKQAIASRNLVKDLSNAVAADGRPLIAPSGKGMAIYGSDIPLPGDPAEAYLIRPKAMSEETEDYKAVNHPAFTKWTWVTKDVNDSPIYSHGDLRVHPGGEYKDANGKTKFEERYYQKLDNIVNRGRWAAEHPVAAGALKAQGFFKATLLAASPFHQIQEGTHAIFHAVSPFAPPDVDLTNPTVNKLLDHGLVIGNFDPVAAFEEGLTSGGALGKIPGFGGLMQKYTDYLFGSYIPRLKTKMASVAYERNMKHYTEHIAQGKVTSDQIADITARQANAAFGELNYVTMGRNPGTQAVMRLMFLAPDFLEARARFAGQTLTRYGAEQRNALLLRGALGTYMTARILNKVLDDDYHWDKPFSLVVKGYEYKFRSLHGDIWNLISDENSFLLHRLNPATLKPFMEGVTGKDDFGRKRSMGEQAMDFVRGIMPIPSQGFFRNEGEQSILDSVLQSAGITRSKYRSKAGALAHEYAIAGTYPVESHHVMDMVRQIDEGRFDGNKVAQMLIDGKTNPRDIQEAVHLAAEPELYRDYYRLPVELKIKVMAKATPEERALLLYYSKSEPDVTRLLPDQRKEYRKAFGNK